MEVWTDYESGKMKTRLEEEFARSEIEIEGLKIEIENLEEVNDTKRAMESRYSRIPLLIFFLNFFLKELTKTSMLEMRKYSVI